MGGVRRSLASLSALLLCFACSGGRETGSPATGGQTADTAASASRDSVAPVPDTTPDTTSVRTPPPSRDTVPNPTSARVTPPAKPAARPSAPKPAAPKPAAPKPPPATLDRPDSAASAAEAPAETTQTAVAPAETTQTAVAPAAEASAPLRDQYHQAPRDTVTAEVYDGWKQFNLNCAVTGRTFSVPPSPRT
jgi:hypothetical protein